MGFGEAIRTCFGHYATFAGRAQRSQYWYFALFQILITIGASIIDLGAGTNVIGLLVDLALLLPTLAVTARRLHDIDRAGWWMLMVFIPIVGWILLLVWLCTKGSLGPNRFGPDPLPAGFAAPA